MEVILELSGHPKANVKKVLITDTVVVGRSQNCGLQIASPAVSRRHCEIRVGENTVSVVDLGSSNGTFINALRLPAGEATPLPPGARLNVGGVRFIVQYVAAEAPSAEPSALPLAAVPDAGGDDLMLVEADEAVELASESNFAIDDELPSAAEGKDEGSFISFADEPVEPSALPAAASADELHEPNFADESLLADEPEEPVGASELVTAEDLSRTADDSALEIDASFDDEPDLEAMFADTPSSSAAASKDAPVAEEADDDVPILEEDEDAAFSFLTDDEDANDKTSPSEKEDSRLGDFLSQLGRD